MRIISGSKKGVQINGSGGIRPTQDNVRKALFDILGDIKGLSFLELFAGSGAVGLEAFSNGAQEVVLIEQDRQAIKAIHANIARVTLHTANANAQASAFKPPHAHGDPVIAIQRDVFEAIPAFSEAKRSFDIIFFDPPYYRDLAKKTLQMIGHYDILTGCGYCVAQHFKKDVLPEAIASLRLVKKAIYGDSLLSFYAKESNISG